MDSAYYGWNVPSRKPMRSHHAPSVREIPVQYVGSDEKRPSRFDSAVKIQKVFRGLLVRRSLKKIKEISIAVEEIQNRMSREETIDSIARDPQERLKFNEMLMNLLFRLDSVRGVDSGVRDFRKSVIRKAIALQEFLDAAFSSNNNVSLQDSEAVGDHQEIVVTENGGKTEAVDEKETIENQNNEGEVREVVDDTDNVMVSASGDGPAAEEMIQTDSETESEAGSSANPKEEGEIYEGGEVEEGNAKQSGAEGAGEENPKKRELLERLVEDNERMMDLMAQLNERNEMQTRLLTSLSQRVEQLERAFLCERLRRKKKRHAAGAVDACCRKSPDNQCSKK